MRENYAELCIIMHLVVAMPRGCANGVDTAGRAAVLLAMRERDMHGADHMLTMRRS